MNILEERKKRRARREDQYRWNLIRARVEEGLTLREVSEKTFYSVALISEAEHGKIYPNDRSMSSIRFFMIMENLYGIPREILRKKGHDNEDLL